PNPDQPEEEPGEEPAGGGEDAPADDQAEKEAPPRRAPTAGMEEKMVNDAVAYIRSLAQLRGRNADWAEKAVREAASLSANEALEENVIDLIASDLSDLLAKLDGREVELRGEVI